MVFLKRKLHIVGLLLLNYIKENGISKTKIHILNNLCHNIVVKLLEIISYLTLNVNMHGTNNYSELNQVDLYLKL